MSHYCLKYIKSDVLRTGVPGTWPICDLDQDDQEQMPVEESGNLLLMIAGVVKLEGWNNDAVNWIEAAGFFSLLNSYADYIVASLPDPGDQLCTDDFEGPSPHNANLAAKGIVALAAWAEVLRFRGDPDSMQLAGQYEASAVNFAVDWEALAKTDGYHFKKNYDTNSSWSLKCKGRKHTLVFANQSLVSIFWQINYPRTLRFSSKQTIFCSNIRSDSNPSLSVTVSSTPRNRFTRA